MVEGKKILGVSGILRQLPFGREDSNSKLNITKNGDLVSLLEQARSAFGESDLSVDLVLYSLQLHSASPHRSSYKDLS